MGDFSRFYWCRLLASACLFHFGLVIEGQEPVVLDYEGEVKVDGKAFGGSGRFRFELVNERGSVRWESDPSRTSKPDQRGSVELVVRRGRYLARVGDPALGHTRLPQELVTGSNDLRLRVWFNDGSNGWQVAGSDTPLERTDRASNAGVSADISDLRRELSQLRGQLARQGGGQQATNRSRPPETPRPVTVPWRDAPALGATNAPLVLMEFADFECPACRRTHETLFQALVTNYVDLGQLLFVSRQMPLPQHKLAPGAARAAYCAGRQGQYFEMYDRLFTDKSALITNGIVAAARDLGLDLGEFERCLVDPQHDIILQREASDAREAGVNATPSFVLGRRNGNQVNGVLIIGGRPFKVFQEEISRLLKSPP